MFGVSFPEFLVLGTVALLVLGPDKLPGMLRTVGQWIAKLRKLTTEVRYQSGIDEVLRSEVKTAVAVKAGDFVDNSLVNELEQQGLFQTLYR